MRVAVTVAPGETRIEERPDPVPAPDEVVCRMLACATCGSDVHGSYVTRKLPAVLGHEPVGEVVEVGSLVTGVAPGDRVVIHHHVPCGECRRCRHGHETLCDRFRSTALDPGGFSEYVRVEAALVPELLPLDGLDPVAATVTEPLACALRAQARAEVRPGDSLLVVGAGCSGLLHIAAAHARGVDAVWVREPDPVRLSRAEAWGATAHGNEPVDAAVVCTDRPEAIAGAADALAPGGRLCLYAPGEPGRPLLIDGWTVFSRELGVTASWSAGPVEWREALRLLQRGAVRTAELITHRFTLEQTNAALEAQRSGAALKAVVEPWRPRRAAAPGTSARPD
ncbi:MAG TPA: alcohol dehydrogenase catalytic domain-containing protein [Solirubrobacteraceae bacterium]|nr:alcohol dehydrogenase catalytic domain-containing protein [Solirubrobacteraceae bacterium]